MKGICWTEIDHNSEMFLSFLEHYLNTIPNCWKWAKQRLLYQVGKSGKGEFDRLMERFYLKYIDKTTNPKLPYSEYYKWKLENILFPYGKWVACREIGVKEDLINITNI